MSLAVSIHAPARGATCRAGDNLHLFQFQSTRPHGARRLTRRSVMDQIKFQSTRPHGARPPQKARARRWGCFNPRARTGRDDQGIDVLSGRVDVSIHAPARGATLYLTTVDELRVGFQSTRPHGARLRQIVAGVQIGCVSIHAPARGATEQRGRGHALVDVSIHAPARGATAVATAPGTVLEFQSTRPHGARPAAPTAQAAPALVSIHAPARGATHLVAVGLELAHVSIHAPARGATSRARDPQGHWQVSIHAPARGATGHTRDPYQRLQVSIHAPARGATRHHRGAQRLGGVSIHAPARGATSSRFPRRRTRLWFQSTRPHGARRGTYIAISPL